MLARHGLLQDDLAAFESAIGHGLFGAGHGFFADIAAAPLVDRAGAARAGAQRLGVAKVHQFARFQRLAVVAEIEFELVVLALFVELDDQL